MLKKIGTLVIWCLVFAMVSLSLGFTIYERKKIVCTDVRVEITDSLDNQFIPAPWFSLTVIHVLLYDLPVRESDLHHHILDKYLSFTPIIEQVKGKVGTLFGELEVNKLLGRQRIDSNGG